MKISTALDKLKTYYEKRKIGIDCKESKDNTKELVLQN
jgi:hypothetical protein